MGIYVRSTQLSFILGNRMRWALGNSKLEVEILAAPRRKRTRLNITQYTFNPQSDTLVISGLKSNTVYNVRLFMMTGSIKPKRRYFVNTFIKTGTSLDTLGAPEITLHWIKVQLWYNIEMESKC